MKHKSKSFQKFKEFKNEIKNQLGKKIKIFWSNRKDEYLSQEFDESLEATIVVLAALFWKQQPFSLT